MKQLVALVSVLVCAPLFAAIAPTTSWEIRTTGASTNGGCFNTASAGTDYSQQDAAQLTLTDVTSNAAGTNWTSAIGGFTSAMVGNCVYLSAGTGFTVGTYQIVTFTDSSNVVVDRDSSTTSTPSAGNIKVGGGRADLWTTAVPYIAGNKIYIKNGTYSRTSTLLAMATAGTATAPVYVIGYNSTHDDGGTRPILTSATNSVALVTVNAAHFVTFRNVKFTHTASTRGDCIQGATGNSTPFSIEDSVFDGCARALNMNGLGFVDTKISNVFITNSTVHAIDMSTGAATFLALIDSVIYNNTGSGIECGTGAGCNLDVLNTVFAVNTNGIRTTATTRADRWIIKNCTFDSNTNSGLNSAETTTAPTVLLENNIFWNNTTNGVTFAFASSGTDYRIIANKNNAYGSNGTNRVGLSAGTNDVTLTGSPFTSSTNWGLNNTAGAGAACRAAGFPGAMRDGTTVGYLDIGAVQHQDSGGAAGTRSYSVVK